MKHIRSWASGVLAAVLLVACGGDDPYVPGQGQPSGAPTAKGNFKAVVSFGTSVSDVGTYTGATAIPGTSPQLYWGGKFTTNGPGATIFVENVATALGLVITPAEILAGANYASLPCPAAAQGLGSTCTAYGQGGAMVTDPIGIRHDQGLLTFPIQKQIANHLLRFGGSFKADDLILVEAGMNEVFVQATTFAAAVDQIGKLALAGRVTPDQAKALTLEAELKAMGEMKQTALTLAGYVRNEVLAKGGKYVVVVNAADLSLFPEGAALPAEARFVLSALSENFNLWLREALTDQPVLIFDLWTMWKDLSMNPTKYGFVNARDPACDKDKIFENTGGLLVPPNPNAVKDGTALFCNTTPVNGIYGLVVGASADTWVFADGNHPTVGGHKALSTAVLGQLKAAGWIN